MHFILNLFVLMFFLCAVSVSYTQQYFNCTVPQTSDCPVNSLCMQSDDNFFCVCLKDYEWNSNWTTTTGSNSSVDYCRSVNKTNIKPDIKLTTYLRSPARKENVALAILLVLVAATLATSLLYLIKVLKPLKRTKKAYMLLKRRRENRHPLQELDEIDLTWRDTNPQ